MNENINLCEILKDCPQETVLYSPMYGNVYFSHIAGDGDDGIVCVYKNKFSKGCTRYIYSQDRDIVAFYSNGTTGNFDFNITDECMLYPSKNQRDWSKFTAPWYKKERFDPKTLSPFDRVLGRNHGSHKWTCDLFSDIINSDECMYHCIGSYCRYCIPYNEETKHLVGTKEEAPEYYRYWED